jgi:parvulin-like peptidyl-prolyl isomerase
MARTKKTAKKSKAARPSRAIVEDAQEDIREPEVQEYDHPMSSPPSTSLFSKRNIILLVVLLLIVLVWQFRGYFIAATVNGQPISRWELNDQMTKRFGDQTLDNIVNERLILGAARQKGIFVTNDEINKKMKEVEDRLKGQATLKEALAAQGMTEDTFRRQLEIQVSIEKMFNKDATVSPKEVDEYILKNEDTYKEATDQAKVKQDVTDNLKQQKISEAFDKWFADIKKTATIKKYL